MPITEQLDFSGGINLLDDPADLEDKQVANAVNMRLVTKSTVSQRLGYAHFNTAAIAAASISSLYQMRDYQNNLIPLAQCNGSLYKGSAGFPNTGTWSSILTETTGYDLGVMDDMWGRLIYTNNKDVPKTYEGTYSKCYGFYKTPDGTNYADYTTEVSDEDPVTYAQVGALDTIANNKWVIIKARVPKIKGVRLVIDTTYKNTAAVTAVMEYRSATATWTAVSSLVDGTLDTATSTKTLNKTGDMTFTECTCVLDSIDGEWGYWLRLSASGAASADIRIVAAYIMYDLQTLPNIWDGQYLKPDGFKKSVDTDVTYIDYTDDVTDDSMSTYATMGAFPITTGTFYIQNSVRFNAVRVSMDPANVNAVTSTLSAKYWNGAAWQTLTISDGTSANSKTLAQSGLITWAWPTGIQVKKLSVDDIPLYQIQFMVSATLSTVVNVAEIDVTEMAETIKIHKLCIYHKNRLFLVNRGDAPNYLFYSAAFSPDVFNGADAGYIGVPSGKPILAVCRFFNEMFVATADEIYLLQGYSPQSFGLLKINTGGIGCVAHFSAVAVGKFIYFVHSTGFYRFDGTTVVYISHLIENFFDDTDTTYFIPAARLQYIQGRFNRLHHCVDWTVSKGPNQTTNDWICSFDVNFEGWWFDDIVASSLLRTTGSYYQDLVYHGDYTGFVHRDWSGTNDDGTAITAFLTTRGFGQKGQLSSFKLVATKLETASGGVVTVSYAKRGATSFTDIGTITSALSGYNYTWQALNVPLFTTTLQYKFTQSTKDYTFAMTGIRVNPKPIRTDFVQI